MHWSAPVARTVMMLRTHYISADHSKAIAALSPRRLLYDDYDLEMPTELQEQVA
jgi:hypothetical protein